MARIDSFLRVVVEQAASDLHLSSGAVPSIRKDGDLMTLPYHSLTEAETRRFLFEIITPEQRDRFGEDQALDFLYELPGVARFRGNLFLHARGLGSVFRIIPSGVPALNQLQLPPAIPRHRGILLRPADEVGNHVAHLTVGYIFTNAETGGGEIEGQVVAHAE